MQNGFGCGLVLFGSTQPSLQAELIMWITRSSHSMLFGFKIVTLLLEQKPSTDPLLILAVGFSEQLGQYTFFRQDLQGGHSEYENWYGSKRG